MVKWIRKGSKMSWKMQVGGSRRKESSEINDFGLKVFSQTGRAMFYKSGNCGFKTCVPWYYCERMGSR